MGFWGFLCPCRWTEHSHLSRLVLIEGGDQGEKVGLGSLLEKKIAGCDAATKDCFPSPIRHQFAKSPKQSFDESVNSVHDPHKSSQGKFQ